MKNKKLILTSLLQIPIITAISTISYVPTDTFSPKTPDDIEFTKDFTYDSLLKMFHDAFPENVILGPRENEYKLINENHISTENTDATPYINTSNEIDFVNPRYFDLDEERDKIYSLLNDNAEVLSFDSFWLNFKGNLKFYDVSNQDIFNVANNKLKKALNLSNIPELSEKIRSEQIRATAFSVNFNETNNKFTSSYIPKYLTYSYKQNSANNQWKLFSKQTNPDWSRNNTPENATITIQNNEFWPSIRPFYPSGGLVITSDGSENFSFLQNDEVHDLKDAMLNSFYKLNLYNNLKTAYRHKQNQYLVQSNNPITMKVERPLPNSLWITPSARERKLRNLEFTTTINYIDEADMKEYAFNQFFNARGLNKINNEWYFQVDYDAFVDYVSNFGKNVNQLKIYEILKETFGTANFEFKFQKEPEVIVKYNYYNNESGVRVHLVPNYSYYDTNWWERLTINVPKIVNNETSLQKIFSLNVLAPKSDDQVSGGEKPSDQYQISQLEQPSITFFSQAVINLPLSVKRNEELLINDKVIPVSLTGFTYNVLPNDKKLKIQVKVYHREENGEINRDNFKIYTITEDLFKSAKVNTVFDEIEFKLHSWDPAVNLNQAQKINPYIIDANFKEIQDVDGNLIPNPDYDPKINAKTGTYEQIWTLNSSFYKHIQDLNLWPTITKLEENKLSEYFAEERNSIIAKTIFADNGLVLNFGEGFDRIDGFYLGNNLSELNDSKIRNSKFSLPNESEKILYFTSPRANGWYLLSATQKTGLTKYYLIYQTNQKFKQREQQNILDKAFNELRNAKLVNNLANSKFLTPFREYTKNKSLDIESMSYSDLVIEYENFLFYNNVVFNVNFKELNTSELLREFFFDELIKNNKLILRDQPLFKEQTNSELPIDNWNLSTPLRSVLRNLTPNNLSSKPELNEFLELFKQFLETKIQNNKEVKNIYSYFSSEPISNEILKPETFEYLNNVNDKNIEVRQPNESIYTYDFSFKYNLDPNQTVIRFNMNRNNHTVDLTPFLSALGYKVKWPIKVEIDKGKIKEFLENKTFNDWNNETGLKEIVDYIKENILNITINGETYQQNAFDTTEIHLGTKDIQLRDIINALKPEINLTAKSIYIYLNNEIEVENENMVFYQSDSRIDLELPNFSNPFAFLKSIKNLSYDNLTRDELVAKLNDPALFNNFVMNTYIDNKSYNFNLNYLRDFYIQNINDNLSLLTTDEYTKYLSDDEIKDEGVKTLLKNLVLRPLNAINRDDILIEQLKYIFANKSKINANSNKTNLPNFNLPKPELINQFKTPEFKVEYQEAMKNYEVLERIFKYWVPKARKSFTISNHRKTIYDGTLSELLSDMKPFKIILSDENNLFTWEKINDFFRAKIREYNKISLQPDKFRFLNNSLDKFKEWLEYAKKLKNSHRKKILYYLWSFLDQQALKISKNKVESIKLFSHFFPNATIDNIIQGIYDGLKLTNKYQGQDRETLKEGIFNKETSLNESFYLLKTSTNFVSPFRSITGTCNLPIYVFSNIDPESLNDNTFKTAPDDDFTDDSSTTNTNGDDEEDEETANGNSGKNGDSGINNGDDNHSNTNNNDAGNGNENNQNPNDKGTKEKNNDAETPNGGDKDPIHLANKIDLSKYKFKNIQFFINNEYLDDIKVEIVKEIVKNIVEVFNFDEKIKSEIINQIELPKFDDEFFKVIIKKEKHKLINGKDYYENTKLINFRAKKNSTILTGGNNFTIDFYTSKDFNPFKKQEEAAKERIIWISSVVLGIIMLSGGIATVFTLNKRQRKVKVF
ncbi:hypothetical protein H9M94_01690 [Mycoplasma sp. Pen4]|uniref:hypothetical protein n=1 Tax=Mycoplasma sp. Pen4 TaxID=640330 RepID=UPI00165456C7|nr:hypothetical protein [Mycoplasma sp. Pen4]QNM93325.1 hypothetical protein H9M94_01690 [Mycoplasma sp. Pen4]